MRAFILTMFILHVIATCTDFGRLGKNDFPIVKTKSESTVMFEILVQCGFIAWAAYLLWGGN